MTCRCCLSLQPDMIEGMSLYGVMLSECFNIQLRVGVVSGDSDICDICIKRLHDAYNFRAQVLKCQSQFEAIVNTTLNEPNDLSDEDKTPDLQFYGTEENPDCGASSTPQTFLDTDISSNKQLTVRLLKLAPDKMKPVPGKMKPVPANMKPLLANKKPVPVKMKPPTANIKPIPVEKKLVSANKKLVVPSAGGKHERRTEMSDVERLQIDAELLFKYSNVTPFQHKSIAGVDCLFCSETLPTMAALRAHTRDTHENTKVTVHNVQKTQLYLKMDILDLQCKFCHEDFDLISTLQEHLTEQHNIQFRSLKNYILEFKLTDVEIMNCARCDSTFETFKMLQRHMSTHYMNYVCEVCAAGFINARLMKRHLRIHETGSHKCSKCDKVLSNKIKLVAHENRHQTKPCPHCGDLFRSYGARNKHMAQVHNVAAATYKCKVCDREFYLKRDLTWHIRKVHLEERNHICAVCGYAFFAVGDLNKHMIIHADKPGKVYKCAVCLKTFARKYNLTEHMRIHNNDRRFNSFMKPVPANMKPVPANMKPVPAKIKPPTANMKPVPAKIKPPTANMKPVPAKMKPPTANMKPVPVKKKPVPNKLKLVVPSAGGKHERRTGMSDVERLQIDAGLLYKYSNATPFQHKSIAGVICLFCSETLPTMAALRVHMRDTHENTKVTLHNVQKTQLYLKMDILDLQCKLCHENFDLISTLQEHLTEQHNIQFRSLKNYILEFKLTDGETMNCARCESTFETFKMLQQHMGTHYKNYVCEVCAAGFINARLLKFHLRIHETGSHKCSKCDKVLSNRDKLVAHENRHQTKRNMRQCPHCGEVFSYYGTRNKHMAQVHNVAAATYKCKVCDREFYLKRDLTWHIRKVHLEERNHICAVCGYAFFGVGDLNKHMITHADKSDKKHKCAVCHKTYSRTYTLREHMRIHNNDRRFQCGACGLRFVQKCSLKGHMMSSHGLALTDCDSEDGVYTCKNT